MKRALFLLAIAAACSPPPPPPDAGSPDSGPADSGPPDAGPPDAGPPDAGVKGTLTLTLGGFAAEADGGYALFVKVKTDDGGTTLAEDARLPLADGTQTFVFPNLLVPGALYRLDYFANVVPKSPNDGGYNPPQAAPDGGPPYLCVGDLSWRQLVTGAASGVSVNGVNDGGCYPIQPW
jgi:hypothetical protein